MKQAELTRQRLVRAAFELFTTRGYHLTTTPLIAKKAGVAEGSIYRHFTGKQHLLNELYRAAARWAVRLVKGIDQGGARDKLAAVARGLVDGAARDPAVVRLLLLVPHGDLLDDSSRDLARELRRSLEGIVAQGKADGTVRVGSAEVWAGVWLAVVGHALEKVAGKEWAPDHQAVALVIEGAWGAIKSDGA